MLFVLAYVTVSYIAANNCATYEVNIIFKSRRSVNFEGKDCISDVQYNLAGIVFLDAWIIPVSEDFIAFIAPLSLSTQNVVSGRHLLHRRSRHVSQSLV